MADLAIPVGAGVGGILVAVLVAFLRSILLAQRATVEQQEGWRSIVAAKDSDRDRLVSENAALRAALVSAQAENLALRNRIIGGSRDRDYDP